MAQLPEIDMPYNYNVYTPAEDTYLFVDALQDEIPTLIAKNPSICVEIGCGSGAVFVYLAREFENHDLATLFIAIDINPLATIVTKQTVQRNTMQCCEIIQMDLTGQLENRLQGQIDVLLFNPPYVPTPSHEVGSKGIEAAWAGGINGREVIDRVLPNVNKLLSLHGVFYMIIVAENKPKEIEKRMAKDGFQMQIVRSTKAYNERLSLLKFTRL